MTCSRKSLVCGSACGLVAGLLVAWLLTGCTTADQKRIQDELDRLNNTTTVTLPTTTTTTLPTPVVVTPCDDYTKQPNEIKEGLIKGESSTRNGRAAVLLPCEESADAVSLNGEKNNEAVGRTNGNRPTFFMPKTGAAYGAPVTVVSYCNGVEKKRWTVSKASGRAAFKSGWRKLMFWRGAQPEVEDVDL